MCLSGPAAITKSQDGGLNHGNLVHTVLEAEVQDQGAAKLVSGGNPLSGWLVGSFFLPACAGGGETGHCPPSSSHVATVP